MEESDNEPLGETDEENELRSRSPLRRNQDGNEKKKQKKKKNDRTQVPKNNQKKYKSNQGNTTYRVQGSVVSYKN